jgi:hypothetical protein
MNISAPNHDVKVFEEPDGTLARICMQCLRTVVMGKNKADLDACSVEHSCGAFAL